MENSNHKVWDPVLRQLVTPDSVLYYSNDSRTLVGRKTPIDLVTGLSGNYYDLAGNSVLNPTHVWTYINSGEPITDPSDKYIIDGDYLYERSDAELTNRRNNYTLSHLSLSGADRFYKELEDWKRTHPVLNAIYDAPFYAATAAIPGAAWGSLPSWLTTALSVGFGYQGAKNFLSDDGYLKTLNFLENGQYKNATYSATGDVMDVLMFANGLGSGYKVVSPTIEHVVKPKTTWYGVKDRVAAVKDLVNAIKTGNADSPISISPEVNEVVGKRKGWNVFKDKDGLHFGTRTLTNEDTGEKELALLMNSEKTANEAGIIERALFPRYDHIVMTTPEGSRSINLHLGGFNGLPMQLKDLAKVMQIVKKAPGSTYIGDSGRPLGDLAILTYNENGLWEAIKTIAKNPKVSGHPLSTDSGPIVARAATKPGRGLRYANANYAEAFNDNGVKNKMIRDAVLAAETPEEQVKIVNDFYNEVFEGKFPSGWRRAYVEDGKAIFPQPIVLKP